MLSAAKLNRSIGTFHRFCKKNVELAETAHGEMCKRLPKRHALFGDVPTPFSLTPKLWTQKEWNGQVKLCEQMAVLLEKAGRQILKSGELLKYYGLPESFLDILKYDPGYKRLAPILRIDGHFVNGVFRVVEINTDGSAGMNDSNAIEAASLGLGVYRALGDYYSLASQEMVEGVARLLFDSNRTKRSSSPPRIAILDIPGMKTASEFEAIRERLWLMSASVDIVVPSDLKYDRGLKVRGRNVNVVYRRMVTTDAINNWDKLTPLLKAYKRGQICMVGSFRSEVLHNKATLAALHCPHIQKKLTPAERKIINKHIPKAAILDKSSAQSAIRSRTKWVLKPLSGYGSVDVAIGRDISASKWKSIVKNALKNGSYLLQEYVPAPKEPVMRIGKNKVSIRPEFTSVGYFTYNGKVAGPYVRSGPVHPLSLSNGAVTRPGFVVT